MPEHVFGSEKYSSGSIQSFLITIQPTNPGFRELFPKKGLHTLYGESNSFEVNSSTPRTRSWESGPRVAVMAEQNFIWRGMKRHSHITIRAFPGIGTIFTHKSPIGAPPI